VELIHKSFGFYVDASLDVDLDGVDDDDNDGDDMINIYVDS
jgi:hypothetical protein